MQRIGKRQARGGVDGFLTNHVALVERKAGPRWVRQRAAVIVVNIPDVHQAGIIIHRIGVIVVVALAAVAAAKHHFMLTARQLVPAAHEGVDRILLTLAHVPAAPRTLPERGVVTASGFIREAVDIHQAVIEIGFGMHRVHFRLPAVIEALRQVGKNFGGVEV